MSEEPDYPDNWVLDEADAGYYMARCKKSTYPIGTIKEKAEEIISELNSLHRPNLKVVDLDLHICKNEHEKSQGCNFEIFLKDCFGAAKINKDSVIEDLIHIRRNFLDEGKQVSAQTIGAAIELLKKWEQHF